MALAILVVAVVRGKQLQLLKEMLLVGLIQDKELIVENLILVLLVEVLAMADVRDAVEDVSQDVIPIVQPLARMVEDVLMYVLIFAVADVAALAAVAVAVKQKMDVAAIAVAVVNFSVARIAPADVEVALIAAEVDVVALVLEHVTVDVREHVLTDVIMDVVLAVPRIAGGIARIPAEKDVLDALVDVRATAMKVVLDNVESHAIIVVLALVKLVV